MLRSAHLGGSEVGPQAGDDFASSGLDAFATSVSEPSGPDGDGDAGIGDVPFDTLSEPGIRVGSSAQVQADFKGDASVCAPSLGLPAILQSHDDARIVLLQDLGLVVGNEADELFV